ncbi:ARM repeat superfamily protein [Raphanus sativus]|nr:ARM repeat superfamily protein [Raphanus sativus]
MLRRRLRIPGPTVDELCAHLLEKHMHKPSKGSTFFKDCIVELRDQNASIGFIVFFDRLLPCFQTLQSIKLDSEFIFSTLVSELQQREARFSLDYVLSLIAALSEDLKEKFVPFLPQVVYTLLILLNNGGLENAETVEQIFTSWSKIIESLRFCFARDIQFALSDIINEKVSKSMSCVVDLARPSQLQKGIKMILSEVAEQPERAARAGFLYYDMIVNLQKS